MLKRQATVEDEMIFQALTPEQKRAAVWVLLSGTECRPYQIHNVLRHVESGLPLPPP